MQFQVFGGWRSLSCFPNCSCWEENPLSYSQKLKEKIPWCHPDNSHSFTVPAGFLKSKQNPKSLQCWLASAERLLFWLWLALPSRVKRVLLSVWQMPLPLSLTAFREQCRTSDSYFLLSDSAEPTLFSLHRFEARSGSCICVNPSYVSRHLEKSEKP